MNTPTAQQVIDSVQRSLDSVLTIHQDGHAFADHGDMKSAIVTGVALAFSGLVAPEKAQ